MQGRYRGSKYCGPPDWRSNMPHTASRTGQVSSEHPLYSLYWGQRRGDLPGGLEHAGSILRQTPQSLHALLPPSSSWTLFSTCSFWKNSHACSVLMGILMVVVEGSPLRLPPQRGGDQRSPPHRLHTLLPHSGLLACYRCFPRQWHRK